MAVWQYTLQVIPRMNNDPLPQRLEPEENDTDSPIQFFQDNKSLWKSTAVDSFPIVTEIDKLVKRDSFNDPGFCGWKGDVDNNEDNDVWLEIDPSKRILSLSFRTDLRHVKNVQHFLFGMLDICRKNGFVVVDLNGMMYEPEIKAISDSLKNSNALKFLEDPKKYIEEFSRKLGSK